MKVFSPRTRKVISMTDTKNKAFAIVVAFLVIAWLTPGFSSADEPGWYGGVSVGLSKIDISFEDWDDGSMTSGSVDDSDVAGKVLVGYRLSDYLSLEAAWSDFGDTTFEGVSDPSQGGDGFWATGNVNAHTKAAGLSSKALVIWSFVDWGAVFASGGLLFWDTHTYYDSSRLGILDVTEMALA